MTKTKSHWLQRGMALLLAVLMCVSLLSAAVFAEDAQTPQQQLEALLDEIYALDPNDYTEESWNELKETADSVDRPVKPYDEATGEGMPDWVANIMITNLTKLKDGLVKKETPQQQLEALLDEIYALDPNDYTEESWNELKETADSVNRPVTPYDEATGEGMPDWVANLMITNLTKLKDALVPANQKTVYEQLEEKLQEAEALDPDKYTAESWAAVQEVIDSVVRPVSAENITEKLATKMLGELEAAMAALVESGIRLDDGTYIAYLNTKSAGYELVRRAKIVAKDGKYQVTLYSVGDISYSFDGGPKSNKIFKMIDRSDYQYNLVEVVNPAYNDQFKKGNEYVAQKNLAPGFDLASSPLADSAKAKVSADNDKMFFDSSYRKIADGVMATTFETDTLDGTFFLNELVSYAKHDASGAVSKVHCYLKYDTFAFDAACIAKASETFDGMSGNYTVSEDKNGTIRRMVRTGEAATEARDGKLYVTYPINVAGYVNNITDAQSGVFCDEAGNPIALNDGKVTLEYDSLDEVIIGKHVAVNASIVSSSRGAYNRLYHWDLAPDFSAKSVVLTDAATGIRLYTSSRYVSDSAKLTSTVIHDSGSTDTKKDAWAFMKSKVPRYGKEFYFNLTVTDGDQTVTDFGGNAMVVVPEIEGLNAKALRLFLAVWNDEWETYAFGWFNQDIVSVNGGYSLLLDKDYLSGNWCIYDELMSTTDGSNLADGTYRVPITTFNEVQPDQTSMSAQCLGEYATLVVKNGVKRLELEFRPVEISDLDGYLIQMWEQEQNGDWKELTYTSYFKNDDGSYFTDALNEGTNNYYPKTGYMILPTDDVQFMTKFRVSAMDAIMGDNGDATRDAIFTIYYDQAEKISDETPDPAPEEIPNFKPADMTRLNELVAAAEQLSEDKYTMSTYTTMRNALANAKTVQANTKATQDEVDSAAAELDAAIQALVAKAPDFSDKNNLPDGKYTLYAQMIKTDRQSFSMSNNAINHNVWLEVKNGEYYLTMQFKGMAIYNKFGYLMNLSYFDKGYTYNEYGVPQGTLVPAEVLSTQKDSDGSDVIDQYNDAEHLYPELLRIKLVDKAGEKYVPLQVFVPVMESIADETGTQAVLMQLDWSTLKEDTGDITPEKPVEQSPAVDFTDPATGVRVRADKGVLPEGVQVVVTPVTKGADYDNAVKALGSLGKQFQLYDVKFLDKDGNEITPNGTVSISLPVPSGYNGATLSAFRINDDGTKTLVKGSAADGAYTIVTRTGGSYALADVGSVSDPSGSTNSNGTPQTGDNRTIAIWTLLAIAFAGTFAALTIPAKRKNRTGD